MSSQRAQRVAETIHKEISSLLIKGLKDPRIGFVTITSVDVTSDLRQAQVYYTLMDQQFGMDNQDGTSRQDARKKTQAGLDSCSSYIRQQLGRQLRLRFIPEIHFEYDTSFDYGQNIERLLSEVKTDTEQDD
ncbi:MAG: 30S ribosome-binding factor RbfA [Desulfuromonadales bacterium]|nr:30S ribosome-binding factor RbfA [Desulfuromonadales bacterium]